MGLAATWAAPIVGQHSRLVWIESVLGECIGLLTTLRNSPNTAHSKIAVG
jgi:hypothetical protein